MKQELVKNLGQVKRFEIPLNWLNLGPVASLNHGPFIKEFAPTDNEEVKLTFYYRGKRVDKQSGQDFLRVLKQPPHQVDEQDRELLSLIIRDASMEDWFETYSMYTEKLNGKTVLLLDGLWRKSNLRSLSMFVDTDNTGTAVQELHFSAPQDQYGDYIEAAMAAFETIKWK